LRYEVISVSWPEWWICSVDSRVFCVSLIEFFFNFIFQHWVDWELSFIICFYLLSIFFLIPWPRYNRLTQVDSTYFLVKFCFQFYYSTLDWLRIEFNNFFYFLSIRLLGSHNLDNKFDRLSRVDPSLFNILSF
jgi:hypothetical protein